MRNLRSAIILLVAFGLPGSLRGEGPEEGVALPIESWPPTHIPMPSPDEFEGSPLPLQGVELSPHPEMVREATRRRVRTDYRGPAQLAVAAPGVFVHQPQQVRVSERTAELWIKLPANAYVSVNFVEYSPVGGLRIFKTKLSSHEARRYYIDAWCPCPGSCDRESLGAPKDSPHVNVDENGMRYVDLMPGDRVVIDYTGKEPCPEIQRHTISASGAAAAPAKAAAAVPEASASSSVAPNTPETSDTAPAVPMPLQQ